MSNKIAVSAALAGAALFGAVVVAYVSAQPGKAPAPAAAATKSEALSHAVSRPSTAAFDKIEEDAIRTIVRNYLMAHPEVLIESVRSYEEKITRERGAAQLKAARENIAALASPAHGYVTGANPAEASVLVVEFFDYHCGFCKKATGFMQSLAKSDPQVKVAFRDLAILREESEYAAQIALAARAQGKYPDLHFAMMNATGILTKDRIADIAKSKGLDAKKLEADSKARDVKEALDETVAIAEELGVEGTPTFVVASLNGEFVEVIPRLDLDGVTAAIAEAKKAAKKKK